MTLLLDVNALIAALFAAHEHHGRVARWLGGLPPGDALATSAITELGYIRVLNQTPQYRVPVRDSVEALTRFRNNPDRQVVLLPDNRGAPELPLWVKTGRQITDGHLLGLADAHGARLVTLDQGIPKALLIPPAS